MSTSINQLRQWVKSSGHPLAQLIFQSVSAFRGFELPAPKLIYSPLYHLYGLITGTINAFLRIFFWTPMFKSRLSHSDGQLYLYGGIPYLAGPLDISIGKECRISGKTTITGRSCSQKKPTLIIGKNVDLGWQSTVAVGDEIIIGDNVRIAGQCFLAGYPGHPIDPVARAKGLPELDEQVGSIILKDDVWLASGVKVMAGVTIGEGTIVAAGSVVTKDLPACVIAAGCPAKVVRELTFDNAKKMSAKKTQPALNIVMKTASSDA